MATDPAPSDFTLLSEATQRLVRTVDGLSDDRLAEPSGLPGWSRAHVVAHLALNAEALERVLNGVAANDPVPMYPSQQRRDGDIGDLVEAGSGELRSRTLQAVRLFTDAARAFPQDRADVRVERVPGGTSFPAGAALGMRWREVEIHHADLDAGYSFADWPLAFSVAAAEVLTSPDGPPRAWPSPFEVQARDAGRSWRVGDGEPRQVVSGDAAPLVWWLSGRGEGVGLQTDQGELPEVPRW